MLEIGLEPAGDCLRKSRDSVEVREGREGGRERGRCGGGSNPGGGMDGGGDSGMAWVGGGFMEPAIFALIDLRYCCLKERRF